MSGGRYTSWWKIALVGILLFLVAHGLVALEASQNNEESHERRTTYSAAAGGYKALYLWFQSMNVPVKRWEKKLRELPVEATVLLVVEPELSPSPGELEALDNWVVNGGTLVVIASRPNLFLQNAGVTLQPLSGMQHWHAKHNKTLLFQPGPYTQQIQTLDSLGHPGLTSSGAEGIVHLRSNWGGLVMVLGEGKGRVIALSDPGLLCNASLRNADHARLATNLLLTHLGSGNLLIDEYHHGYGSATTVVEHLLSSRALTPLLQGALLLLVLWTAVGRRFGSPRVIIQKKRRSSLEYVRAMAQLYQRAPGRMIALESLVRWIEREATCLLVSKDRNLQNKLLTAKRQLAKQEITEKDLLGVSRGLYSAFEEACRTAEGSFGKVNTR